RSSAAPPGAAAGPAPAGRRPGRRRPAAPGGAARPRSAGADEEDERVLVRVDLLQARVGAGLLQEAPMLSVGEHPAAAEAVADLGAGLVDLAARDRAPAD